MKIFTVFLLFIAFISTAAAQVTNGLVARYSFNSGNANDEAGLNHGVVNGATLTTDRFGNPNQAYHFIGVDSNHIMVPHHSAIDFSNTDDFTVSLWIKTDPANQTHVIILSKQLANGSWNGYSFLSNGTDGGYCNGQGTLFFYTAAGAMQDACADVLVSNDTVNWNFITGVYNGSLGQSYLYVNGALQSDTGGISGTLSTTADLYFGGFANPYSRFFSGSMDDIRIYNRALNAQEIDSLMNEANPTLSIDESNGSHDISVYPNPAREQVSFNGTYTVIVNDMMGKIILRQEQVNSLMVSDLPSGLYTLSFMDKNGQYIGNSKFIKN